MAGGRGGRRIGAGRKPLSAEARWLRGAMIGPRPVGAHPSGPAPLAAGPGVGEKFRAAVGAIWAVDDPVGQQVLQLAAAALDRLADVTARVNSGALERVAAGALPASALIAL